LFFFRCLTPSPRKKTAGAFFNRVKRFRRKPYFYSLSYFHHGTLGTCLLALSAASQAATVFEAAARRLTAQTIQFAFGIFVRTVIHWMAMPVFPNSFHQPTRGLHTSPA